MEHLQQADGVTQDMRLLESQLNFELADFFRSYDASTHAAFVAIRYDHGEEGRPVRVAVAMCKVVGGDSVRLLGIFVDEGMRRKGIGRVLVEHVEGFANAQGCRQVILQAMDRSNQTTDALSRLGFSVPSSEAKETLIWEKPVRELDAYKCLKLRNYEIPPTNVIPTSGFEQGQSSFPPPIPPQHPDFEIRSMAAGDCAWLALGLCNGMTEGVLGFDSKLVEGWILGEFAQFLRDHDPEYECTFMAVRRANVGADRVRQIRLGGTYGCRVSDDTVSLRMLYVDRSARGLRLGSKLADLVLDFARAKAYAKVQLITHHRLQQARRLYEKRGFRMVDRQEDYTGWGYPTNKEWWELDLHH